MTDTLLSDHLLQVLYDSMTDTAICLLDENGLIADWNQGAERLYQAGADSALGKSGAELFKNIDFQQALSIAFSTGRFEQEWTLAVGNGRKALVMIQPVYTDGQLRGYSLLCRSLFYEKKFGNFSSVTSGQLHTDSLFQQLIEHSYSGISLLDADLNMVYRSPSAARITGFTDNARAEASINEMIHPADQAEVKGLLEELLHSPGSSRTCFFRTRHFQGHFIELECVFTNLLEVQGINAIVLNFHDVTKSRASEAHLEAMMHELSAYKYALDEAAIVAVTDQTGRITHVNDYFCRISGYTREELLGQDHRIINSGYHEKEVIRELWRTIAAGKIWYGELCNRAKDGHFYWVATTIVPFLNQQGKPYRYMAIRFDITAAKHADEELRRKSEQISDLLEGISDGFLALDDQLRYTYVNAQVCKMLGLKAEQLLGRYVWDLFPDAVGSKTYDAIMKAHRERVPVINEDYYPPLDLWQENRIYPGNNGLSIFISDISLRKRVEMEKALLSEISLIFNHQDSMAASLSQALQRLIDFSGARLGEAWLISSEPDQLFLIANATTDEKVGRVFQIDKQERTMPVGKGLPGATFAKGKPEYWEDLPHHPEFIRKAAAAEAGIHAAIGIPLQNVGERLGVILLGFDATHPSQLSEQFLIQLREYMGAEVRRKQLKRELQQIFESVPDVICTIGEDRRYKRVNKAMCDIFGYTEAELLNKRIDDLIHPDEVEDSRKRTVYFRKAKLETMYFENRYLTKSGKVLHLAWTVRKATEKGVLFCVAKDITEKKELEQLLQKASELARIGTWEVNLETGGVFWSTVMIEILEVPPDFKPKSGDRVLFCTGEHLRQLDEGLDNVKTRKQPFDLELEITTYKGQQKWIRMLGQGEYQRDKCIRIYGSLQDIDARKRAQLELMEKAEQLAISGERYSELFHMSPLPMWVFDLETLAFLDVNEAALLHYGYTREELMSMTIRDIRPADELPRLHAVIKDAHRRQFQHRPGIFTHIKKNGEQIQVEIVSSSINYQGRSARLALMLDVTERNRHLAEIEAQNRRLRDISWLQSHVIRAPLSRLMGLVNLLEHTGVDEDEYHEVISYIRLSANELDRVIHDITSSAAGNSAG
ncbi:PAS domain S-box protein [Mucilaginibacter sp. RS28]|uniref:histidine kinase n=1 Tax=Mucilaginibacter straminoryzae TaxID=2932774 RepID=A0A9X1WZ73_9SPHI|nr:PAS domain S-box protein [Mucilaginibacter straminoryzae]MCJ8208357.1 PAS domain S-box protein [Mucilaginibacter straminoryzae]